MGWEQGHFTSFPSWSFHLISQLTSSSSSLLSLPSPPLPSPPEGQTRVVILSISPFLFLFLSPSSIGFTNLPFFHDFLPSPSTLFPYLNFPSLRLSFLSFLFLSLFAFQLFLFISFNLIFVLYDFPFYYFHCFASQTSSNLSLPFPSLSLQFPPTFPLSRLCPPSLPSVTCM